MRSPRLLVFVLSPSIDRAVFVCGLKPSELNRALSVRVDAGGKGVNIARVASRLGMRVLALGLLGAGGDRVLRALEEDGVEMTFEEVPGDVRVNLKIIDQDTGQVTEVNEAGPTIHEDVLERLYQRYESALADVDAVIATGSLPPGVPTDFYARAIGTGRRAGAFTVVDTDGLPLRLSVAAGPDLIKPNRRELAELTGDAAAPAGKPEQVLAQARRVIASGAHMVCASLGHEGAVLVRQDGAWWAAPPLAVTDSGVGAGDALLAAITSALLLGEPPAECLRWGIAAGTATAAQPGTQLCTKELVERLRPTVRVVDLTSFGESWKESGVAHAGG